jgi:MoaA/NifB/PqqE/SkfB family radical SAM enzyme
MNAAGGQWCASHAAAPVRGAARAPRLVSLEVTTRCNLACAMCPHGIGAVPEPSDAPDWLVERLWPAMETAETLHLNGVGEPLLARPFWTVIDRLAARSAPTIDFNTNGLLLNAGTIERLAKAPLGRLLVSFDAATERTYARIRGGSFAKAKRGTRLLAERLGDRADIKMTFIAMRENFAELTAFVELARDLGVRSVWFSALTDPALGIEGWSVRRGDGWTFDYAEQQIARDDPELIAAIGAAAARGAEIDVVVAAPDLWRAAS